MGNTEIILIIGEDLAITLPNLISLEELQKLLAAHISQLIQEDFHKLIAILYRVDVSETKLKQLLKNQPADDAGKLIATLIIERQLQKIKTRQQFSQRDDFAEEEKW